MEGRCVVIQLFSLFGSLHPFTYSTKNGDLNWIIYDKILAFAGPHNRRTITPEGYCTLTPADYIPYFQRKNVGLVVEAQ